MSFLDMSDVGFDAQTFPIPDGESDPFATDLPAGEEAVVVAKNIPFTLHDVRANDWNGQVLFVNIVATATYPDGSEHKGEVTYKLTYDKVIKARDNGKPSKDYITLKMLASLAAGLGTLDSDALESSEDAKSSCSVIARAFAKHPPATFIGNLRWRRGAFDGNDGTVQYDTTEIQSIRKVKVDDLPF